jgi:hypothetical protein
MPAIIRPGSKGATVTLCQERLIAKGYNLPKYGADGDYGRGGETETAIRQFQQAHNLTVDAVVGDKTWDLLLAEGKVKPPSEVEDDAKAELLALMKKQLKGVPKKHRAAVRKTIEYAVSFLGTDEIPRGSNWGPEVQELVDKYNEYWWTNLTTKGYEAAKKRGHVIESDQNGNHYAWCGMFVSNAIRVGLDLEYWDHEHGYEFKPEKGWHAPNKFMPAPLEGHPWHYFWGGPGPVEEWARTEGFPMWEASSGRFDVLPGDVFTQSRAGSGSDPTSVADAGHIGLVVGVDPIDPRYVITIEGNISQGTGSRRRLKRDLRWFVRWHQ